MHLHSGSRMGLLIWVRVCWDPEQQPSECILGLDCGHRLGSGCVGDPERQPRERNRSGKHLRSSLKGAPAPLRASMLTPLCLRNFPKRGGAQKPGSKLGPNPARCRGRRSVGVVPSGVRVVPRGAMGVGSSDYSTSPGGIEPGLWASGAVVVPLGWSVAQQIES